MWYSRTMTCPSCCIHDSLRRFRALQVLLPKFTGRLLVDSGFAGHVLTRSLIFHTAEVSQVAFWLIVGFAGHDLRQYGTETSAYLHSSGILGVKKSISIYQYINISIYQYQCQYKYINININININIYIYIYIYILILILILNINIHIYIYIY